MKSRIGNYAFLIAVAISLYGTLIHWIAPVLGPDWYEFLQAPRSVVQAARAGEWSAPLEGGIIGGLMFMCALYGLSGAGKIRPIPLMTLALPFIAALCLLRGLALLPLWFYRAEFLQGFDYVAALVWFCAGLGFAIGTTLNWRQIRRQEVLSTVPLS